MSSTDRQNNLLISEDWKKIYQSFRNADFQSYDFENLRRTMIDYIRTNYPEDFNDYIESSEYLALIDLMAFLGQSIAFRVDLNARENFLELASRRDSILRLARLVSYNAKRNVAAQGLLKFTTVQTTETVIDSNGRNLAGQVISWNDSSNTNWYDQFIKVLNASLPSSQQFGSPAAKATIYGIPTEQYRFSGNNSNVPVYSFTKSVAGNIMNFEITSTTFSGETFIYEEPPKIGLSPACVYRDDGHGNGSTGTGFFFNFTQGTLNQGTFTVTQPSSNLSIDIDAQNINNNDVWLYQLDQNGLESALWTQVPAVTGNNIIYNSLNKNIKNIYEVLTRTNDAVSLAFSDGTFGNLPLGNFRTYYRISNGLNYVVNPGDVRNVSVAIPYTSVTGSSETLTISLGLFTSASNATSTETNASIKTNAPQTYYTQNRMITGEDYNISPLSVSQQISKVKSINRASSGISRYFDLVDPTGKYSSTNLFADDGILYQDKYVDTIRFQYSSKTDIEGIIYNTIADIIALPNLRNFYYSNFISFLTSSLNISWYKITSDTASTSSGYVGATTDTKPYQVGSYTATDLKYFTTGALVKFTAPTGQYFDTMNNNVLVTGTATSSGASTYIWAEVVSVSGDGTANGTGTLGTGFGPIVLNQAIPSGALIAQLIPKLSLTISSSVVTTMIDLIFDNKPFGLRYDATSQTWQIILESNLNITSSFSLNKQGDTSNTQQDASWILLFTTDNEFYTVTTRLLRYIFESDKQVQFYFDSNSKIYDKTVSTVIRDTVNILSINTVPDSTSAFTNDLKWDVISEFNGLDGYVDNKKILISFKDSSSNGVVDNPQLFLDIVAPTTNLTTKYIVEQRYSIATGQDDYKYISNATNIVKIKSTKSAVTAIERVDGQYFYFIDTDTLVKYSSIDPLLFVPSLDYKVYIGRDKLKFQYTHSADYDSRIDPGASNIIDVYILTKSYDTSYRQWLAGANVSEPLPPSTDELYNLVSAELNLIKSISDEIVYHPVSYKLLFGASADLEVQATFNVVKNPSSVVSDNDVKSRIITAMNQFFSLTNWDFGDTFYFSELSTYIITQLAPDVTSFVIVPVKTGLYFGSLFEIQCPSNNIFINGATVNNINIVSSITSANIKTVTGKALSEVISQNVTSSNYGSTNG
jgi:hypothetical protein